MFWILLLPTESKISILFYYKHMGQAEYKNHLFEIMHASLSFLGVERDKI